MICFCSHIFDPPHNRHTPQNGALHLASVCCIMRVRRRYASPLSE
nr:MAG TPA: hypothetical protein [Caudoviricetes sp.]